MNKILKEIYTEKFKLLKPELEEYNSKVKTSQKATNPFLLKVPHDYESYQNRVMIFGQETNAWCKECGQNSAFSNNIEKSLDVYQMFYLDGGYKTAKGPFWNEFKRIKKEVEKNSSSVVVWNNINKIGRIGKGNFKSINEIQFRQFKVINDEINLLHPNIVVFLTGPNYDPFIQKNIGDFHQTTISESLQRIDFSSNYSDINFFKTYHPNGLYHQKKNRIVIPNLISEIKNALK